MQIENLGDVSGSSIGRLEIIPFEQRYGDQGTFYETERLSLLIFQKLILEGLVTIHVGDNRPHLDTKAATDLQTAATVDQAVAAFFKRAEQYRNTLSVCRDGCFEAVGVEMKAIIEAALGFNRTGVDFGNPALQASPVPDIRSIAQCLQGQSEFRFSCHPVPTSSG